MKNEVTPSELDGFGLSNYEIKSYLSLLEKNQMTASEVSRLAGVPFGRIYDVLDQLNHKGLCQKIASKVKLYSAVDPSLLKEALINLDKEKTGSKIEKLKEEIRKEKEYLASRIKTTEHLTKKLTPIYQKNRNNNNELDYIEIIKDLAQLRKRIVNLLGSVESELISFCPSPLGVSPEMINEQYEKMHEMEFAEKGIKWLSVYEIPKEKELLEWLIGYLDKVTKLGEQVRVIEQIPVQMFIVDQKCVVIQLEDPVSTRRKLTFEVVHQVRLAQSFRILFDVIWERSKEKEELVRILDDMKNK